MPVTACSTLRCPSASAPSWGPLTAPTPSGCTRRGSRDAAAGLRQHGPSARIPPRGQRTRRPRRNHTALPSLESPFPQNSDLPCKICTLNAFTAPSCGDSASVQRRGQLGMGRRKEILLLLLRPCRQGQAAPSVPGCPAGTCHVPAAERGWGYEATPRAPRPPPSPARGDWHGKHDAVGSGTAGTAALLRWAGTA